MSRTQHRPGSSSTHGDGPPRADRSEAIESDTKATQSRQVSTESDARPDGPHGHNTEPDSNRKPDNFTRSKSASKMGE